MRTTLFDFTDPSAANAWHAIDDRVMGGISRSTLRHHPAGHALFEGTVSLERNGGFASVRSLDRETRAAFSLMSTVTPPGTEAGKAGPAGAAGIECLFSGYARTCSNEAAYRASRPHHPIHKLQFRCCTHHLKTSLSKAQHA